MHTTFFYLHVIYRKCLQSNEKEKQEIGVKDGEEDVYKSIPGNVCWQAIPVHLGILSFYWFVLLSMNE